MGRVSVAKLLLLGGALVVAAAVVLGTSATAEAQISCDDQAFGWEVSTTDEFNQAVACHNSSADPGATSNIILLNDISADTIAGDAVFATIGGGNLIIVGQGHTLRRVAAAPTDAVPVVMFETSNVTLLGTVDLAIEVGPHDTAGIEHNGPSVLRLVTTSIAPGSEGSAATGVISSTTSFDGSLDLVASSIEGLPLGLDIKRLSFGVEASTIASTNVDISAGGASGISGFGRIVNSTLGGPIGLRMDGGGADVDNSTILGDAAVISAATNSDNVVSFRSSIVNTCSAGNAAVFPDPPTPGWSDRGFNVGSCFPGGSPVDLTLADNGCRRSTPVGCPLTAAIDSQSPARDAGLCVPGEPFEGDQRGFPRNPQAAGCDAGSFEAGCPSSPNRQFQVATAVEFNQAVICHNFADDRTDITLLNDIVAQSVDGAAVFPTIEKDYLVILGEGHSLSRSTSAGNQLAPLLSIESPDGPNESFWAMELGIEVGPWDTHGIMHHGPAPMLLQAISIYPGSEGSSATGIESIGGTGFFELTFSSIEGLPVGLRLQTDAPTAAMGVSTIASTGIDIDVIDAPTFYVDGSTLGGPTGIQMTSGAVRIGGSTILGDGASLPAGAADQAFVSFTSSIVNSCTADQLATDDQPGPGWVDLGSNAGSCFGTPAATEPLADNGCRNPTPTGCPRTSALRVSSPAIAVGDCSANINTDQRGEPRTPIGPGCDAGAFEFDPCAANIDIYGGPFEVFDAGKFVTAISCFNQGAFGPGDYTIEVRTDIDVDTAGQRTTINQPAAGYTLTIAGYDSTIALAPVPSGSALSQGVLSVAPTNAAPVTIQDISITPARSALRDTGWIVRNESPATLTLADSFFSLSGGAAAVLSDGGGDVIVDESLIEISRPSTVPVGPTGITMSSGQLTINRSTIGKVRTALGRGNAGLAASDAHPAASLVGIDQQAGTLNITNSTFASVAVFTDVDVSGTVSNSTLFEGGIPGIGDLIITSSILNECDPILTDGGGNVGSCFGSYIDLGFVNPSCGTGTSSGCPLVYAISANSPARGAGDCTGVPTDQRGEPRTPVGPGCDAGAFESAEPLPGDVNDDDTVDNADVQALLVWLAGGSEPVALLAGDVTGDGSVKLDDALAIAQLVADG